MDELSVSGGGSNEGEFKEGSVGMSADGSKYKEEPLSIKNLLGHGAHVVSYAFRNI